MHFSSPSTLTIIHKLLGKNPCPGNIVLKQVFECFASFFLPCRQEKYSKLARNDGKNGILWKKMRFAKVQTGEDIQ